jgi:hypothetical protein
MVAKGRGQSAEAFDMMIAAHAAALDVTLMDRGGHVLPPTLLVQRPEISKHADFAVLELAHGWPRRRAAHGDLDLAQALNRVKERAPWPAELAGRLYDQSARHGASPKGTRSIAPSLPCDGSAILVYKRRSCPCTLGPNRQTGQRSVAADLCHKWDGMASQNRPHSADFAISMPLANQQSGSFAHINVGLLAPSPVVRAFRQLARTRARQ